VSMLMIGFDEEIQVASVAQVTLTNDENKTAYIEICGDGVAQQVTVHRQETVHVELFHNLVTIKNKSKAVVRVSW